MIDMNGQQKESMRVKLSLVGWIKMFWSGGNMWFREADGSLLYSKMDPDEPQEYIQLIEEK